MSVTNEAGIILPPEIICQQVCSVCHKYLSVGPVLVTCRERIICGRCKVGSEEHFTPSLYNRIATECLFPCTIQDCPELLPFAKVKDHEKYCSTKRAVSCPFCNYKADERKLVQHFKEGHSEYIVDDKFEVIPREGLSKNLIFLKDGHIMCINVIIGSKFLKISNTLLAPSMSTFGHFTLSFFHFVTPHIRITHNSDRFPTNYGTGFDEDAAGPYVYQENSFLLAKHLLASRIKSALYQCEMNYIATKGGDLQVAKISLDYVEKCKNLVSSLEFSKPSTEIDSLRKVGLYMDTTTLRLLIKSEFVEMHRCIVCNKSIRNRDDTFFCLGGHLTCTKCSSGNCRNCNTFTVNRHSPWHNTFLKCEWNCNSDVNVFEYMQHVQLCKFRQYKCPDRNCTYVGPLDDFKKHWHLDELLCGVRLTLTWEDQAFYWLLPNVNELVSITIEKLSFDHLYITVYDYDVIFPTSFKLYGNAVFNGESKWILLKNLSGRFLGRKQGIPSLFLNFKIDL